MGSKNQLIDEIFEICDSIMERSFKNQQSLELLIKKNPLNETLQQYQLVPVEQFEDQSRNRLKQLSIDELKYLLDDAQQTLDLIMQEELKINKLGMRIPKNQIETNNYEQWDFLLQWPKSNNLDSIIMNIQSITNNIYTQLQKNTNKQYYDDNIEIQYQQALEKIEYLEMKLEEQNNQKQKCNVLNINNNKQNIKEKTKLDLMDELENKLLLLEVEKEKMSTTSMEAFSKLLQYK